MPGTVTLINLKSDFHVSTLEMMTPPVQKSEVLCPHPPVSKISVTYGTIEVLGRD